MMKTNFLFYRVVLLCITFLILCSPAYSSAYQGYTPQNAPAPYNYQANYYQPRYPAQQQYPQAKQQSKQSPVDILETSIKNVLAFLALPQARDVANVREYVNSEIAPNFDFEYMSKWVAAKRYYAMTKQQQAVFNAKFKDIFLTTFVEKMTQNNKSLPAPSRFISRRIDQNEARASVLLSYETGQRVKVDFRFFNSAKGWKVVDIKANGMSALMYFRNYFIEQINKRQQ